MTSACGDNRPGLDDTEPGDAEFSIAVDYHQQGLIEQAAAAYSKAISVNNRHSRAIHNLATIMLGMDHMDRAQGLFKLATEINPDYAEAFSNWGLLLNKLGKPDEALEKFKNAVDINPSLANVHIIIADYYREQGRFEDAIPAYEKALDLNPESPNLLNNLGICYRRLDRYQEAVKCFDKALALKPGFVDSLVNSANALGELELNDLAIERLKAALEIDPNIGATHNNLGIIQAKIGQFDEALDSYQKAIDLNAVADDVMNNLANTLNSSGRSDEAIEKFDELLAANPEHYVAINNLGTAFKDMARYDEAELNFRKSIEIAPDYAEGHANLGYILLVRGELEAGWQEYSWRGKTKGSTFARRVYDQPAWEGQNITGKTVYIYPEQGLGDIVQFSRYAALLKARGAKVVMEIPTYLTALLKGLKGVDAFNLQGTPPPPFDMHVSIMDLPQLFSTTLDTIPSKAGYLSVDPEVSSAWSQKLNADQGYKIGIVWAGNPKHGNDRNRSLDLEHLRPLIEIPGVSAYSLQVGKEDEAKTLFGDQITDLAPQLTTFAETAGAMDNLDLIISVDTSPLHVAGALGRPVWGLIPFVPDWRWLLDRDDSPWYPSLKLFRQDADKSWEPVIECVKQEIELMISKA